MQYLLSLLLLSFLSFQAYADAVIAGKIMNTGDIKYSPKKEMKIEVYTPHLSNQVFYYTIPIQNDSFSFDLKLVEPQVVTLKYLRRKIYLYLEPQDTLFINGDADNFIPSIDFSGKAAINNEIYAAFKEQFPEERNQFKMMQYRKGTMYYKVGVDLDGDMRQKSHEVFKQQLDEAREAQMKTYNALKETYGIPSENFEQYMWADISYSWAYNLLTYGHAHGFRHKVPIEFFFFVHKVPLMNERAMGNEKYRDYLVAYLNYVAMTDFENDDPFIKQIELAKKELTGRPLSFFLSNLLTRGMKKDDFNKMLPYYQEFLKTNEHEEFNQILVDTYQEVNRYLPGQLAPNFSLVDTSGNLVSLSDFNGKIVYMDFWASWCRPCIRKMEFIRDVKTSIDGQNKEVVFLHISFDSNREEWLNKIRENNFTGIHLMAPESTDSEVAKSYDVRALPEYFIITKNQTFASKPQRFDILQIQETLENLAQ